MLLLLATFLMDLRHAGPVVRLVAFAGVLWVIFLFALTFTDYLSRRASVPQAAQSAGTLTAAPACVEKSKQAWTKEESGMTRGHPALASPGYQ